MLHAPRAVDYRRTSSTLGAQLRTIVSLLAVVVDGAVDRSIEGYSHAWIAAEKKCARRAFSPLPSAIRLTLRFVRNYDVRGNMGQGIIGDQALCLIDDAVNKFGVIDWGAFIELFVSVSLPARSLSWKLIDSKVLPLLGVRDSRLSKVSVSDSSVCFLERYMPI